MKTLTTIILSLFFFGICNAQKTVKYSKKIYTIGVSSNQDEIAVLTKDYIELKIKYNFLTSIKENDVPEIHNKYGSEYIENICRPTIHAAMREAFVKCRLKEIFSTKRETTINELKENIRANFQNSKITLERLLIKEIELPQQIKAAMQEKMAAQQEIEIQKYKLEVAKMNSQKELIKAESIAKKNQIIDASLTEKLLKLKYIETLSELSKSKNTKVLILGNNKLDLPEIFQEKDKK